MDSSSTPNTAPMHDILQDALDDLVSTRTSTVTKGEALVAIEHVLAETSDPRAEGLPRYFNALQDTFQCNVSSRIIAWTSATTALLERSLSKGSTDYCQKTEVITLATQLAHGMAIIQGVALVHNASKQFLGRRYPLEVLLTLLMASRHLNPPSASTPASPSAGASPTSIATTTSKPSEIPLASIVIDTLLCILVDSIPALRVFEDLNGVQIVVKILKRAGTPREVRMKCLEFLYFYLLDENAPPETASAASEAVLSAPDATPERTASSVHRSHLSTPDFTSARTPSPSQGSHLSVPAVSPSGYSTSPSSRSSSSSSAFSVLSTSTTGTSASLHDSPSSVHPEPSKLAPKTIIPGFIPSQRNVTPPTGGPGALGRGQPRSLLMLRREIDYVPLSPKKPQISHLGRGPSGLRERSNLVPRVRGDVLSSEGTEAEESAKSTSTRPARPRVGTGMGSHSRGLSVSSISSASSPSSPIRSDSPARPRLGTHSRGLSVSSLSSASTTSSPTRSDSPARSRGGTSSHSRGLSVSSITNASSTCSTPPRSDNSQTPSREKAKGRIPELQSSSPSSLETPKASSKMHRRTQSLADFASSESPSSGLSGPRSASTPTGAPVVKRGPRTMQEKKEILGTMLGNVDALVEGVKKAGVWGLS
ncbi:hypothetical protein K466DRAFT_655300 [Polyporus arcularius HHB13444]|uniref:CDC14-domain-containing protein n=1 Tax=Polyporus arcularius HHB13444 TaxID=1314778 RepID=A0A5C3P1B7_9APHY|nr:hypothetical protein K466DRAFT_655300 [Polyporus arcularius HHB13444]